MLYRISTVDGDALVEVRQGNCAGSHITVVEGECEAKHMIAAHQCFYNKKLEFKGKDFTVTVVEPH